MWATLSPDGRKLATVVSADMTVWVWDPGPDDVPAATSGQALFTLRLPKLPQNPGPWDFDFRCTQDQATCWIAVPPHHGPHCPLPPPPRRFPRRSPPVNPPLGVWF